MQNAHTPTVSLYRRPKGGIGTHIETIEVPAETSIEVVLDEMAGRYRFDVEAVHQNGHTTAVYRRGLNGFRLIRATIGVK